MRTLLTLLLSTFAACAQLTIQSAHYPTLLKASSAALPTLPESGATLWLAPESRVFNDQLMVTNAAEFTDIRMMEDLSGAGNHAYWWSGINAQGGPMWTNVNALNGRRTITWSEGITVANKAKTGLLTSNNVAMSGGFTVYALAAFWTPSHAIVETAGCIFGYNGTEALLRRSQFGENLWRSYHNSGGLQLVGPLLGETNWQVVVWTFNDAGNTGTLYHSNAVVHTAADGGSVPASGLIAVGFRSDDGVNSHFAGGLAELIFFPGPHTSLQVSNMWANYFKPKFAL
jgi:hypothetical protein